MKNVFLIPTDKPSILRVGNNGNFVFGLMQNSIISKNDNYTNQHLYIINDEEIKEGDWYFRIIPINVPQKASEGYVNYRGDKKIILTTDEDLIKDDVQRINDEFLEWFIKNPNCEFVKVESFCKYGDNCPSMGAYNKQYLCDIGYKTIIPKEESKQEILEEVAEKYLQKWRLLDNIHLSNVIHSERCKNDFIAGVKWQQEQYNTSKITRVEVIQHSPPYDGRAYTNYNAKDVEISFQDDNRTLKIFLK